MGATEQERSQIVRHSQALANEFVIFRYGELQPFTVTVEGHQVNCRQAVEASNGSNGLWVNRYNSAV